MKPIDMQHASARDKPYTGGGAGDPRPAGRAAAAAADAAVPASTIHLVGGDRHALAPLVRLLRAEGLVMRTFATAAAFLAAHDPELPGCVVLDLVLPDMCGLALQQALQHRGECSIVFLSGHAGVEQGVCAMKAGALDFLTRPVDDAVLAGAVRRALAHDAHRRSVRRELRRIRGHLDSLTRREQQVLRHVVAGRLNKQIASDLGIAEKTIKVHRARAMEKMGAGSLAQLVREMLEVDAGAVFDDQPAAAEGAAGQRG
jgi:two-component system response regulator FixJ